MNYKGVSLTVFLLPFAIASYGNDVKARIQELKVVEFQKERELSDLGEMIAKRDEILRSFHDDSQYLLRELIKRKTAELEVKNGVGGLSEEEKQRIADESRSFVNDFLFDFCKKCDSNENIENILSEGLVYQEEGVKSFESLRFFLIRCAFERDFIMRLVKKYEICIQETRLIKQELKDLEKVETSSYETETI
ncbi:MAG: hypothetical protein NTX86_02690 [Candidatus Dependentiae bacterium]|nr:hypothetical protein [Candidatus Dependentiae bacterium]